MLFHTASWKHIAGQNDVPLALHVPMVYENIPASTPHWEYRVLDMDTHEGDLPNEAQLNELGTQGWMQVSALTQTNGHVVYYLLRQIEA